MAHFVSLPQDTWRIHSRVPKRLRTLLRSGLTYERIVRNLITSAQVTDLVFEPLTDEPNYRRIRVSLCAPAQLVTTFHSASSGYRAQYYESPKLGDEANRYALSQLHQLVMRRVREQFGMTECTNRCRASLGDAEAKIWIKEGVWWRHAGKAGAVLMPPRWAAAEPLEQMCDPDARRVAWKRIWCGRQIPDSETRFVVLGGWIDAALSSHPSPPKPGHERSLHIHMFGFT